MKKNEKWEAVGKIISSNTRKKIFYSLNQNKIPSQICRETNIPSSNVSKSLKELKQLGVVKCITPQLRKGRIYKLTQKGKEIYKIIKTKE